MSDDRKDLPPITAPNFLEKMRETVSTYLGNRGNLLDRGLTLRDMSDANLIALSKGFLAGGRGAPVAGPGTALTGPYEPDLTPPPTPNGFSASMSKTSIQVVTAPQIYSQGHGHAKTRVYGAKFTGTLLTFSDAVVLDEFSGDVHAFPVDPASEYRLWVTWVTQDGQESPPAGGTNGFTAVAGLLDDVNIAFLTASKIRAGAISVGEYIQSSGYVAGSAGWRINGDGTAEFANAVVRGSVYATYGFIGGNTIDSTGLQSPSYAAGATGWRLDSGGVFRAFGYSGTRILDMAATGTSPAIKFGSAFEVLGNGTATFAGALSAATGTFSGALSAATGTFAGALSAATGTFAGSLSAATGTFSGSLTAAAVNAVNTINLAGNSVSVVNSSSGTGATIATTLTIPPGETMRVIGMGFVEGTDPYSTTPVQDYCSLSIDGDSTYVILGACATSSGGDSSVIYGISSGSVMGSGNIDGGIYGRTITVSLSKSTRNGLVVALGTLR